MSIAQDYYNANQKVLNSGMFYAVQINLKKNGENFEDPLYPFQLYIKEKREGGKKPLIHKHMCWGIVSAKGGQKNRRSLILDLSETT